VGLDVVKPGAGEERAKRVFVMAPSSVPTKRQLRRPTTWRRRFQLKMLLWTGRRPSSRKR
jgi:hypothetical protein